jgi:hypothetical protein
MGAAADDHPGRIASGGGSDAATLYRIAFEEGRRLLDDQLDELNAMRGRAVQYLAFVGTASAFLVGTGLHGSHRDGLFYAVAGVGTALSLVTVGLATLVLLAVWPSGSQQDDGGAGGTERDSGLRIMQWKFRLHPAPLVNWIEPDLRKPNEADLLRALALREQQMYAFNKGNLDTLRLNYVLLIGCGAVQLIIWGTLAWLRG